MAKLCVVRPPLSYGGSLRRYKILVDGVEVGRVAGGDELAVEVGPGRHRVSATIDRMGSNEVVLDFGADDQRSLVVAPNGESSWDLLRNLRKTPGRWLRITALDRPDSARRARR